MAKNSSKAGKPATNAQKTNGNGNASPTALIDADQLGAAPAGFEEVFGARVAGWWAPISGNVIQGILKDTFETDSKFRKADGSTKKKVYKIQVTDATPGGRPCLFHAADAEEGEEPRRAMPGDLIGVDEKGWLKSLGRCIVGQEVYVGCLGKEPPSAEYPQGAWKYKVLAKPANKVDEVTGEVTS